MSLKIGYNVFCLFSKHSFCLEQVLQCWSIIVFIPLLSLSLKSLGFWKPTTNLSKNPANFKISSLTFFCASSCISLYSSTSSNLLGIKKYANISNKMLTTIIDIYVAGDSIDLLKINIASSVFKIPIV